MAITRIFRVRVAAELSQEFEQLFSSVSIRSVSGAAGFLSVTIHRPTQWTLGEYAMISQWRDEESLVAFAGENWNRAKIPHGMEKYIEECWVHHYESWTKN